MQAIYHIMAGVLELAVLALGAAAMFAAASVLL